ncbi:MAG TPA: MarR family transcriptional regulator [Aliidongia sp.]|nr:MarR family transcriptional regulator [Aliidongia sp.]
MSDSGAGPETPPGIDDLLCFAVYSTGHAFNRVYKPLLDPLGLTYPQYLVMVSLWAKDGQRVGELGEALFLESSTLTPLLKRLEAAGYLTRSRDPSDERQVRVRLTAAGTALSDKARHVPRCILEATGLSVQSLIRLQGEIASMRDNLLKAAG